MLGKEGQNPDQRQDTFHPVCKQRWRDNPKWPEKKVVNQVRDKSGIQMVKVKVIEVSDISPVLKSVKYCLLDGKLHCTLVPIQMWQSFVVISLNEWCR